MRYSDTELRNWDDQRLRVGREKRNDLLAQARNLIESLEKEIPAGSVFKVVRFRRAGSLIKATALYPRGDTGIDADIAVYLDDSEASDYDLSRLHATLREIVRGVYPNKADEDFWIQPQTLGMEFRASGLKVDLVPLLAIEDDTAQGWMVDSSGQKSHIADIPAHIEFVREIAKVDDRFRPLVRMAKAWRNEAELKSELGSFQIELILAHINEQQGPAMDLEEGIVRFFHYLVQSRLEETILSGHADTGPVAAPVVILDPAEEGNNVAEILEMERQAIIGAATAAWETLHLAVQVSGTGETRALWQEVFGHSFTTDGE